MVDVHQVVRDHAGKVLSDGKVQHVYMLRDGLVERMDVTGELDRVGVRLVGDRVVAGLVVDGSSSSPEASPSGSSAVVAAWSSTHLPGTRRRRPRTRR